MAVGDIFERLTWSAPGKTAIIGWKGAYGSGRFARLTYGQADAAANQVANALLAEGLRRQDPQVRAAPPARRRLIQPVRRPLIRRG